MNDQTHQTSGSKATRIGGVILLSLAVLPMILDFDDLFGGTTAAEKDPLQWVQFDEGTRLAKETGKKMLVDVYTDWCTWCKKMDSDVYTSEEVKAQISKHFIPVKLNAESQSSIQYNGSSMTNVQFSRAIGVTGYPATLFLNEGQEPITLVPGFIPADRFAVILAYIGEDHYKSVPFQSYLSQSSPID